MIRRLLPVLLLLLIPRLAIAEADPRMQVELATADKNTVAYLRANIDKAAELALPKLWLRIVVQDAIKQVPDNANAMSFLQRATPSPDGITVTFNQQRVVSYLKKLNIQHIADMPAWKLSIKLSNASGRSMPESAAMLAQFAETEAENWGYGINSGKESLVLHWRWLDSRQVELSIRGTSKVGEYAETRTVNAGDPFLQLKPWLSEVLLKARNAYSSSASGAARAGGGQTLTTAGVPLPQNRTAVLSVERRASLPEQVLFEEELRRDPRILALSLRQVNRDGQQYHLTLKGADDQWLPAWFKRRGFSLTPSVEGWVAR